MFEATRRAGESGIRGASDCSESWRILTQPLEFFLPRLFATSVGSATRLAGTGEAGASGNVTCQALDGTRQTDLQRVAGRPVILDGSA
jgi:hypothetical protein